jgi:hypothetical protein
LSWRSHIAASSGDRWEWMMLGGVMDLVLAAIILAGLQGTLA